MAMDGDATRVFALAGSEGVSASGGKVETHFSNYHDLYKDNSEQAVSERKKNYMPMVNRFYDLVTTFYEYGWGSSFHFAPRSRIESFEASIARHEHFLAFKIKLQEGQRCLDVGCGVGGPQRCIARFTRAVVTGLNNNAYQIGRARALTEQANLTPLCNYVQSDFMNMPEDIAGKFDAAYQIEATCHAPDKAGVYRQVLKALKPGGYFGGYEWVMTNKYDPHNAEHRRIKNGIEVGNGVANLETQDDIVASLKAAGFEVLESRDLAPDAEIPWYHPLQGQLTLTGWRHTRAGHYITHAFVSTLEALCLAPKGVAKVSSLLMETSQDLVQGGQSGIFTPMFFVLARKPL